MRPYPQAGLAHSSLQGPLDPAHSPQLLSACDGPSCAPVLPLQPVVSKCTASSWQSPPRALAASCHQAGHHCCMGSELGNAARAVEQMQQSLLGTHLSLLILQFSSLCTVLPRSSLQLWNISLQQLLHHISVHKTCWQAMCWITHSLWPSRRWDRMQKHRTAIASPELRRNLAWFIVLCTAKSHRRQMCVCPA